MTMLRLARGVRLMVLGAVLIAAVACNDSSSNTTPTLPTQPTLTETFTGTLSQNGAATFPFAVNAAGGVTATLANLVPVDGSAAVPIGLGLGTWNGSICNVTLSNDTSLPSSTVPAQAAQLGNFCVRVYDAAGRVTVPENYVITVLHP